MREVSPLSLAVRITFFLPSLLKELAHLYAFMKLLLAIVCQHTFTKSVLEHSRPIVPEDTARQRR